MLGGFIGVHGYLTSFEYDSHSENRLVSHLRITRFRTGLKVFMQVRTNS